MSNVTQWIEKFQAFGARPSPENYAILFDPEGTVFDSGMERPLKATEVAMHMGGILKLMPDLHITVHRWRERKGTVFVDAQNAATIAGRKTLWDAVYCVTLRGDRVIRGRRYYDRAPLLARVSLLFHHYQCTNRSWIKNSNVRARRRQERHASRRKSFSHSMRSSGKHHSHDGLPSSITHKDGC